MGLKLWEFKKYKGIRLCGLKYKVYNYVFKGFNFKVFDALPSSFMDSTMSPKVKTTKGEGIGVHSLIHSTSGVEGRAEASGWD